jgi:hypothetical protein
MVRLTAASIATMRTVATSDVRERSALRTRARWVRLSARRSVALRAGVMRLGREMRRSGRRARGRLSAVIAAAAQRSTGHVTATTIAPRAAARWRRRPVSWMSGAIVSADGGGGGSGGGVPGPAEPPATSGTQAGPMSARASASRS